MKIFIIRWDKMLMLFCFYVDIFLEDKKSKIKHFKLQSWLNIFKQAVLIIYLIWYKINFTD
jgi:hypothetical protein